MPDELQQKAPSPAKYSVQSRADATPAFAPTTDVQGAGGVFWITLGQRLDEEPQWNAIYPNWRDRFLLQFRRSEPMVASAVYSMKTRMGTLNYTLNGPPRAKKFAQELLNSPGLGDSLPALVQKLSDDLDSSDNGAFLELWRPGSPDKAPPKSSPVLGFAHLDSRQCWRSFDPEFPVWYTNPVTGQVRKLHKDRVVFVADNPQPVELARGIGFCAVSRAARFVRIFRSMEMFVDEKIGGRFTRAIGAISGVSAGQVKKALSSAQDEADSRGFVVYNQIPFLIDPSTEGKNDIKILLQDLASIPDGFNFRSDADLYAYILAFCFGVDAREFWPATTAGATKADAAVQHMKARGRGIGNRIQTLEYFLRAALPETVEFEYDFTDDEQDELQARIRQTRQSTYSAVLRDGGINTLEYRALLIADGILDGKLLEDLDLPADSDDAPGNQAGDALENNSENSADPQEGASKTATAKSADAYRRALRSLVRGYWSGALGEFDFYDGMATAIRRHFTQAWRAGMQKFGLAPDAMTEEEQTRLRLEINTEIGYVAAFADAIAANSKANGGALTPLLERADLWVNAYGRIESLAGTLAAADAKGKWEYGDTTAHCVSCSTYAGRVYRNSVWRKYLEPHDLMPRGKGLACKGFQCDCSIVPTDEPITKGYPPVVKFLSANSHGKSQTASDHAQTSAVIEGIRRRDEALSAEERQRRQTRLASHDPHLAAQATI